MTAVAIEDRVQPIAAVLVLRGIRAYQLAETIGYSPSELSRVINGHKAPSRRMRAALQLALGIPAELLFLAGPDDDPHDPALCAAAPAA